MPPIIPRRTGRWKLTSPFLPGRNTGQCEVIGSYRAGSPFPLPFRSGYNAGMNYRRPVLPWIVAASFIAESAVFAVIAMVGAGPGGGLLWGIGSAVTAMMGIAVVLLKLRHGSGPR